jgi:hypothetical protein
LIGVALCLGAGVALGQGRPTPLLEDDLKAGRRTKIDAPKDELDAALDGALGKPSGFSTAELERLEDRLRQGLKRERPRATPRLIVFLYPGKVSAERLRSLAEINVDIELVIDPCERAVCQDAVARHIELVGQAVGQPVFAGQGYKLIYKTLTLKTVTAMAGDQTGAYVIPIADCIAASKKPGGGAAWLAAQKSAENEFEPRMVKAIAVEAARRRVALKDPPSVARSGGEVTVALRVRGDRGRLEQAVLDALAAAARGLRSSPATPPTAHLEVQVETGGRPPTQTFRAPGAPIGLYLDGSLDARAVWSSYVAEVKKGPGQTALAFDDAEARGGPSDGPEPDDNEAISVLSANFAALGACARAEAQKNPRFAGVTIELTWTPEGRAADAKAKEPSLKGGPLERCLRAALTEIRLPRFSGTPRLIAYPIRVK